jgi:molecular chaperone GrpE
MNKEELKKYICDQIDSMDEEDIQELQGFFSKAQEEESIAEELIVIKGEMKKMVKLVNSIKDELNQKQQDEEKKLNNDEIGLYIKLYQFLEDSKDSLDTLPKASIFNISKLNKSLDSFKKGYIHIENLYNQLLNQVSLRTVAKIGEKFDPSVHEALEVVENRSLADDTIVQVLEQGFFYKENLVSYAKVKVNKWV